MKVIMLDIDGVLTTIGTKWMTFHPDCAKALKRVVDTTGAKIVLSSSWRHGFIDWRTENHALVPRPKVLTVMRELLEACGIPRDTLISKTPDCPKDNRGHEISMWLQKNAIDFGVQQFVILDDDDDVAPHHAHFVQTSWGDGMNEENADQAILILTSPAI